MSTKCPPQELNLNKKDLSDITFLAEQTNLEILALEENQITDITPLKELSNLKELHLCDNPLNLSQIEELRQALPNCNITF